MKIIDEKGRLFGKINLIDLLVIVLVIAIIAAVGWKLVGKKAAASVSDNTHEMTFTVLFEDQPAEVDYAASPSCKPAVHRVSLDLDQAEGQTEPEANVEQTDCPGGSGGGGIGVDIP